MTKEKAIEIIKANIDCMQYRISGTCEMCVRNDCDNCKLAYLQGTAGDGIEALKMAVDALQEDKT